MKFRSELKLFNAVIKEIDALYGELASRSDLTDSAFWVLYYLAQMDQDITQNAICKQWFLSKQTVNNAIQDLQKKHYIYLTESPSDRRSKQIFLTEAGKLFTKSHIEPIFALEESVLMQMGKEEIERLIGSNAKYLHFLRQEIKPSTRTDKL